MEEAVVVSSGRVSDSSSVHKIRSIMLDASALLKSGSASQSLLLRQILKLTQRTGLTYKQAHTHESAKGVAPIKLKYPLKDMLVALWIALPCDFPGGSRSYMKYSIVAIVPVIVYTTWLMV
ncbi:hypothetical protein EZV62_008940 [Acer yangbiense]|uniref:Uncharacterized protein n=1 Tax=Acer yangbiense TaxID=1000413 RepID=A0A5C7IF84_9ROSI|nr:hypothetical protein EZV62_008940 [Acer yangbiense]